MEADTHRQMNALLKQIDDGYMSAGTQSGLSDSAFDILYALATFGEGCTQRELCDRCYVGKQTVNSSIKRLVEQGYVNRTPGRGRSTHITLTERGRALVDERVQPVIDAELFAISQLSETDQAKLLELLRRYRDGFNDAIAAWEAH